MIIFKCGKGLFRPLANLSFAVLATLVFLPAAHGETPLKEGYIETFDSATYRDRWWFANYESGGPHSGTSWRRRMAKVVIPFVDHSDLGGALVLSLAPAGESADRPFLGAEGQLGGAHHYGDYETIMQAGRGDGVVTAFFTYTGPHFGDPHDEIDFEILGKDTNSAWINRFVDGKRMPGQLLPLGFDSAAAPHHYKFSWREDRIVWSVDGKEIHRITSDEMPIPSHAGKVFLSLWAGNPKQVEWLGEIEPKTRTTARFHCVSFRPWGDMGATCETLLKPPS